MTSKRSHRVHTSCDKHRTLGSTQCHHFQSVIQSTAKSRAPEKHRVQQIAHAIVLRNALNFHVQELFEQ